MIQAVPAVEAAQLYNETLHLPMGDEQRLPQILWRLQALVRRLPHDPVVKVALLQALVSSGRPSEANTLAEEIWAYRNVLVEGPLTAYTRLLWFLGKFDLVQKLNNGSVEDARLALAIGDVASLRLLSDGTESSSRGAFSQFLKRLEEVKMTEHLAQHQEIVRSVIGTRQLYTHFLIHPKDEQSAASAAQCFYMIDDFEARSHLSDDLYTNLQAYYKRVGLEDIDFWDVLTPMFFDYRALEPKIDPIAGLVALSGSCFPR